MDGPEHSNQFAKAVSRLTGWIYVLCWSASFYPQPVLNWQRKSTHGLSIDYPTINVLGFVCYAISTSALLYSPLIRQQYTERHSESSEPTVRFNDLAFAIHAVIMSSLTYSQFWSSVWGFKVSRLQRLSRPVAGICLGTLSAVLLILLLVLTRGKDGGRDAQDWAWIDVVYTFGHIKLLVTFIKYMPQAWINYQRKSTDGFSIFQVVLDLCGSILSIAQLLIDASLQSDWSGVTGNPVKLGLGNAGIVFGLIFLTQHYILYREAVQNKILEAVEGSEEPFLANERDDITSN